MVDNGEIIAELRFIIQTRNIHMSENEHTAQFIKLFTGEN
jgi:hypothetical protein